METDIDFSTISAFVFSGVSLLLCAWLILSKQKLIAKNTATQNKLVVLEAKLLSIGSSASNPSNHLNEKKTSQPKNNENNTNSGHHSELLSLRKETAKLKDDLKKSKEEIKLKEKALKEEENATNNKLFSLTEENARLIIQMKEMDQLLKESNQSHKNQVPLIDFEKKILEISQLKEELVSLKQKLNEIDKFKKQNSAKLLALQDKLKLTEQELQKWTDTAKLNDGKSLDPSSFLKWHDRALSGRKMYRLMRQMRELSDSKVTTYQEGVMAVSKWVLDQKNLSVPSVSTGEVLADRLLAEAWNAILLSNPNLSSEKVESEAMVLST